MSEQEICQYLSVELIHIRYVLIIERNISLLLSTILVLAYL